MAKNQTYRAFVERPSRVLDLDGELLDSALVLTGLASEVSDISSYATYVVRNDEALGDELERVTTPTPAMAGRSAGVSMPDFLVTGTGKSGRSRKEKLIQYNVVTGQGTVPGKSESRRQTVTARSMSRRGGGAR